MDSKGLFIAWYTIVRREILRGFRLWAQNFLPSIVTSVLYFLIFGAFLGSKIGDINGVSFLAFVVPGLVMLSVVTNSFMHSAFLFFGAKFFNKNITEMLVSPMPPSVIISSFVSSGVFRGIIIGTMVILVSLFFEPLKIYSISITILFLFLTSLVFSLAGLVNGVYAKSFDSINIVPTFILTPLIYLGGVFYSTQALPPFWQQFTYYNPIFYIINGLRYGLLGFSDVSIWKSISVLLALAIVLVSINWYQLKKGLGLRQ